jgi:S-adenosylhomocysteine hydrolase/8-oxo-dGTP pyrophosphatase MutT (NUDIX family)
MTQNEIIKDIFEQYLHYSGHSSHVKKDLKLASQQIETDIDLTNRKNFKGHITASIFLLCKKTKRVLLLDHKALKMMLQPGGHIDPKETPLKAALRELAEETGIKTGFRLRSLAPGDRDVPLHIDTYPMPQNPEKNEAEHFHHDFQYLATIDDEVEVSIDENESNGYQWVDWDEFVEQDRFKAIAVKIEKLAFSKSAGAYYESLFNQKTIETIQKNNYSCLAVQHIILNSVPFLRFLKTVFGDNLQVLAKPKSIDEKVMELLKQEGFDIIVANRADNFEKYLSGKTILLDIGGYFARIVKKKGLPIVGVIEDTENGLQAYEKIKREIKYPVVSVARSELKNNEDRLVGDGVAHAVDTILRGQNIVIDYCKCGVIGYGKVGAGIVRNLLKRNVKPYIAEIDPVRLVGAVNNYCYAVDIEYLVSNSMVIFGATGNMALTIDVLRKVKNGAYIASVTSSDSELDIPALEDEYQSEKVSDQITKYTGQHNYFYLINGGNAVNFLYNAALDRFIYLAFGEQLLVVDSLLNSRKYRLGINHSTEDTKAVAAAWIQEFLKLNK